MYSLKQNSLGQTTQPRWTQKTGSRSPSAATALKDIAPVSRHENAWTLPENARASTTVESAGGER